MSQINRRDFLRSATSAVAGSMVASAMANAAAAGPFSAPAAATPRTLAHTGIACSLLGMGTGVKSWNGRSRLTQKGREEALSVFAHAYERGLRYFDLADMYGSHPLMKTMLRRGIERDKVMISTKTVSRDAAFVRADLDRMRTEIGTDYVDAVLIHCLTDRDGPDWTEKLRPVMDVLDEAKAKGVIRAHGCSCHDLGALEKAAACDWVDVILARINPAGVKMDGPVEEVVPVLKRARANGKAMLAMKVVGEGALADRIPESMRFVLGLDCFDAMTIGFLSAEEIDRAVAHLDAAVA